MAYGTLSSEGKGWLESPPDVLGAGRDYWAETSGIPPTHPLVGGSSWDPMGSGMQPDWGFSRLVTTNADGGAPPPMGTGNASFSDWREVLNFRGSPVPYILLALLAAIGFIHLRLQGGVGPYRAKLGIG